VHAEINVAGRINLHFDFVESAILERRVSLVLSRIGHCLPEFKKLCDLLLSISRLTFDSLIPTS